MVIASDFRLSTELVVLRPMQFADAGPLHETVMADAEVMRYIGSGRTSTREEAQQFVARCIGQYPHSEFGWYAVTPNSDGPLAAEIPEFCGVACLKPFAGDLRKAFGEQVEVGYWLAKAAWGRGVATSAASALVRWGFEALQVPEIAGVAHALNLASKRVLQKAGLHHRQAVRVCDWPLEFYSRARADYMSADQALG
jgi:RimJ/RimL family protein N-acetyltransferase